MLFQVFFILVSFFLYGCVPHLVTTETGCELYDKCRTAKKSYLHYVLPSGNHTATIKATATAYTNCKNVSCTECKKYSKDCVCGMVKPQYCVKGKPCKLFPRCIPREQSCLSTPSKPSCSPGNRCELHDVTCVKAPCWPAKECVPMKCPPHQKWHDCGTCQPICGQPIPFCPAICGKAGCQCIEGFSRNNTVCVPSSSCKHVGP